MIDPSILRRRAASGAAVIAVAAAVAGCGATVTVSTGPYWLVKVKGAYGNVYQYPSGNKPGTSNAVELGDGKASEQKNLAAAAKKLGIPLSHITDEASS